MSNNKIFECPKCKNMYSTAYSMYRHMRKVHHCDINRCVTLYCPIENCNNSYDRYNALDTHLTHAHYADIRKENLTFSAVEDFESWLKDITASTKTKFIKRSCNNSYRYYRCHRSGLPKTSTERINTMKSSVKIGRHCPSRVIAKITGDNVQVEFVPTHIGHNCETAKLPLNEKKRLDIACRLANPSSSSSNNIETATVDRVHHNLGTPLRHHHGNTTTNSINSNTSISAAITTNSSIVQTSNNEAALTPMVGTRAQQRHNLGTSLLPPRPNSTQTSISQQQPNPDLALTHTVSPNRLELTARFDQLMRSLRSDKHASIVKAQLDLCFALIRE